MNEHNFKVGDRVKADKTSRWKQRIGDAVGLVVDIKNIGSGSIKIKWETSGCVVCGRGTECRTPLRVWHHPPSDIYKINVKGEQLLFSFMKGD